MRALDLFYKKVQNFSLIPSRSLSSTAAVISGPGSPPAAPSLRLCTPRRSGVNRSALPKHGSRSRPRDRTHKPQSKRPSQTCDYNHTSLQTTNKTSQNIEKDFFNLLRFCLSLSYNSFQHFSMWPYSFIYLFLSQPFLVLDQI